MRAVFQIGKKKQKVGEAGVYERKGYLGNIIRESKAAISSGRDIPFIYAHHVVCALEAENGEIYTGFCIESCSGVMDLCAERTAALNMYLRSGQTVVKRMIAFRDKAPCGGGSGMPCGACREFFMQLSSKNQAMEIMVDYEKREITTLGALMPNWWGMERLFKQYGKEFEA